MGQDWTHAREIVENIHMRVPRSVLMELTCIIGIEWEGGMAPKLGMIVVKREDGDLDVSDLDENDLDDGDLDESDLEDT